MRMLNVAIIPARGGSKRILRKNIRDFCGRPMIAHSIIRAKDSGYFDKIIVSTDDEEVASIAREWGAEVPFRRPAELADDHTGTVPVIQHAIEWLRIAGHNLNLVCCIYATAPFLSVDDLKKGAKYLENADFDFAFSVAAFPSSVQRGFIISDVGGIHMLQSECFTMRSQDLVPVYHDAGQFYWGRADTWMEVTNFFTERSTGIVLPKYRVQDIDDVEDWRRAELMFLALQAT